jgi:hypothetical protein
MDTDKDADSVEAFCERHDFSRAYLYKLWKQGLGPEYIRVGSRRLITRNQGRAWRASLELEAQARLAAPSRLIREGAA